MKKINLRKYLTLAFLCPAVTGVYAQSQPYSLNESIRIALQNNEKIKNSRLDIASGEYQIKEAKSALLPKVELSGQYLYYTELPSQYAPATAFGGPEGEYTKLTLNLPQTTSAGIQSSINIFNQAALTGLQTARAAFEASNLQEELTREEIVYNVSATYYSIQILDDNLARLEENIVNLEKTVKIDESLNANDLVSDNVHKRLLINLENLRNQYENQRLTWLKYMSMLKYYMNMSAEETVSVEPFRYDDLLEKPGETDISNRADIQLQQQQIKMAELEKKSVVAGYYPVLTGGMSFGYAGYYNEFAPGKQLNHDWINSSSFSLNLRIPLFDGFQKNFKMKQKQVSVQKSVNTLSMMKVNAEREIHDAVNNYTTNANQLESNRKSLELAEQLFASSQREFENGLTSTTELLNAQNDLSSARTNYSNALLNLKLAELSWRKANGSLLETYTAQN